MPSLSYAYPGSKYTTHPINTVITQHTLTLPTYPDPNPNPNSILLYAYPGVADSTEFDREILPYTLPNPHHTITSHQHILSTHPINTP